MKKKALLQLLKEKYPKQAADTLFAQIICGEIYVNGEKNRNPKALCEVTATIQARRKKKFVSRGGEKLHGALDDLAFPCQNRIFLDCGASSGGFTDCLLKHGAAKVYAIDVGYAQFDFILRQDPRVTLLERTNIRSLTQAMFQPLPDFAVVDLSFRSLVTCITHIIALTAQSTALALVKPQFEWKDPPAEFSGVVENPADRQKILWDLIVNFDRVGIAVVNMVKSCLPGRKGNVEYFFLLKPAVQNHDRAEARAALEKLFLT